MSRLGFTMPLSQPVKNMRVQHASFLSARSSVTVMLCPVWMDFGIRRTPMQEMTPPPPPAVSPFFTKPPTESDL